MSFLYRVAAAGELTELHDHLNVEVKKLQEIHFARYGGDINYAYMYIHVHMDLGLGLVMKSEPSGLLIYVGLELGWKRSTTDRWS